MTHEIVVLDARIRVLESENYSLREKSRKKDKQIRILQKEIRRLKLKIPHKLSEEQLNIYNFI